ncbi:helix-turn-helix domain-containing protein [Paenibacillus sp. LMG 31460]|uniref:Helix-turn-helix domain-containing protein n=1 Tax=Paenibacillus germinis TaxID=2654979 RepID=A0ABX1Z7Q1_9BACL|nr:helix-turn-helix domain-containing protein [Paenibacillus germinis]NOU88309.1 helix-turn-helix domain-containing protein [Paenibacillus germinis]
MKRFLNKRSEDWRRLILSYLALTIVIILVIGGYLTKLAQEIHTQELSQENLNQLQRVQNFVEENYLNRYELSMLNKAMTTIRSSSTEEINFFMENGVEGNYYKIVRLSNDLRTLKMASPGLENISIYFKQSDMVVDQDYFYQSPSNSPNNELLRDIDSAEPHRWFARTIRDQEGAEKQLLSYIYTLPYRSKGMQVKGYMIIDLDVMDVVRKLQALIQNPEDRYYIFTEKDVLAVSNTMLTQGNQLELSWANLTGKLQERETRTLQLTKDGKEVSLSAYESNSGWKYVSLRPVDSTMLLALQLKSKVWVISLVVLLIGIILSYMMSLGFHKRMQGIKLRLQQMLEVQHSKHLQDLLVGRLPVEVDQLPLQQQGLFVVALLEVDPHNTATLLQKQFEMKKHVIPNFFIPINNQQTAVIYCVDHLHKWEAVHQVRNELEHLRIKLSSEIRFAAAIGSVVQGIEQIQVSYTEAQEAMEYVFIEGMSLLLAYEELEQKQPISIELLESQALENKLRSGEEELVREHYQECARYLIEAEHTIEAYEMLLHHIALTLAKVVLDTGKGSFRLTSSDIIAGYRKSSLKETLTCLEDVSIEFMACQKEMGDSLYERIALQLKEYIDLHLDQDLSLDDLAEYAAYSKQFISKVFKERYHCTLADYMSRQRLELARKLLLEKTHTIAEIAQMSGFRSVPYFTTKFKQFWGVTPAQFRNQ